MPVCCQYDGVIVNYLVLVNTLYIVISVQKLTVKLHDIRILFDLLLLTLD